MNERAGDYIRRMRQVVAEHVDNTSLRRVARQLGMSPAGLRQFLDGAAPYTPTLRRLRRWYPRHAARAAGNVDPGDAAAALTLLLHELAPAPRGQVAARILETLARAYEASGKTRPEWIEELGRNHEPILDRSG